MACPPLRTGIDGGFVQASLAFVDCQARTLGALGYQALAAPGSIVSLALTVLLTLFVAGFGFRMLMGETPGVRDGVMAVAKIGFVLALATAWGPYRTLVYDVVVAGPAELVAAIGAPAGLPGSTGDLAARLDLVDRALIQLNDLGLGRAGVGEQAMRNRQVVGSTQVIVEPAQGNPNPVEPYAFALGRILFLIGAVGAFGAVRLIAGLLLALGPLFVALALFDTTRGLFEGWVRALVATILGTVAVAVLLASELAMVEGWIAELLTQRLANAPIFGAAIELVVVTIVFDLILVAGLVAVALLANGFRLPVRIAPPVRSLAPADAGTAPRPLPVHGAPAEARSRAGAVVDGIAAVQRREAQARPPADRAPGRAADAPATLGRAAMLAGSGALGHDTDRSGGRFDAAPLGRTHQRRSRTSSSAARRDRRS